MAGLSLMAPSQQLSNAPLSPHPFVQGPHPFVQGAALLVDQVLRGVYSAVGIAVDAQRTAAGANEVAGAAQRDMTSLMAPGVQDWLQGVVQVGVVVPLSAWTAMRSSQGVRVTDHEGSQMVVIGVGSGFFIDACGNVLTCEHVRNVCQRLINRVAAGGHIFFARADTEGRPTDWQSGWVAEVHGHTDDWNDGNKPVAPDPARVALAANVLSATAKYADAAILRPVSCLGSGENVLKQNPLRYRGQPITALPWSAEPLREGAGPLYSIGFPLLGGNSPTSVPGHCTGHHHDGNGDWIKFSATFMPGHSGGPAVNLRGEVVAWIVRDLASAAGDRICQLRPISAGRACIEEAYHTAAASLPLTFA